MNVKPSCACNIQQTIDWPAFMARHDLLWDRLPHRWENGVFLGNGLQGTLMHADLQLNRLRWWFCRSDVGQIGSKRTLPNLVNRKVIGSLDLVAVCDFKDPGGSARLDLWNAEAIGNAETARGVIEWRCFVPEAPNVVILELEWKSDWIPDGYHVTPTFQEAGEHMTDGDAWAYAVPDVDDRHGGGYTVAWRQIEQDCRRRIVVFSVGASPTCRGCWNPDDGRGATEEVLASVNAVTLETLDAIRAAHRKRWHAFYPRSFVSMGNTELESYYWIQLYKLRSAGRPDGPMIDNHGPWSTETCYGFATWDMNVQATHRLHFPSGHPEMSGGLLRFMDLNYNTETMFDPNAGELRAGVTHSAFLKIENVHAKDDLTALGTANCDAACKFLWACHNLWLHYRFTLDPACLEPLAERLEAGINTYVASCRQDADGRLHADHGYSWEACHDVTDPLCYIAVMDWALRCRTEIDRLLGRKSNPRWTEIANRLPDYPQGPEGYHLAPGQPPVAHRHWSHLMQIWPFHIVNWDQPENRPIIQQSIDHWVDLSAGPKAEFPRAGFAVAAAIQLYAHIGNALPIPALAEIFLREWTFRGPACWASTLYRENGPVIESPLLFADALLSTLLQSWNNTIRIFPAWPATWGDAVFHDLRAEGRFSVSAAGRAGNVDWVSITSHAGEPCTLRVAMPAVHVTGNAPRNAVTQLDNGVFKLMLPRGATLEMRSTPTNSPISIKPVAVREDLTNAFGLNARFLAPRQGKARPERLSARGRGLTAW